MENTKPKVVAIIQARIGSTRLPGKALKKIQGRSLIEWIQYRLSFCATIDDIILCTADNAENDLLAEHAKEIGLKCFRGSETDLIKRLYGVLKEYDADGLVRITGDCPLVDPKIVDNLVNVFRENYPSVDYVCNILPPTYPDGIDVEVMSTKTFERLDNEVTNPLYREWLTMTILENPDTYHIINVKNEENLFHLRLTVDYPEDFLLVNEIFNCLHKDKGVFCLEDILDLLKERPDLLKINEMRIDKSLVDNIRSQAFQDEKKK